jgi:hypothetical protein
VPGWSRPYGRRIDSWKMPASKTRQDTLALDHGRDGFALVSAVYTPGQPVWLRKLPAVQVLRQVLLQNHTRATARNGAGQRSDPISCGTRYGTLIRKTNRSLPSFSPHSIGAEPL